MLDPINGYVSLHNLLKIFSFFIPKILKIFKKQQQQMDPSAGKSTIPTELVPAASSHKHPKAQIKRTAGHPNGGATPDVRQHLSCLLRLLHPNSPPLPSQHHRQELTSGMPQSPYPGSQLSIGSRSQAGRRG